MLVGQNIRMVKEECWWGDAPVMEWRGKSVVCWDISVLEY